MALFSLMVTLDDERNNVLRQVIVDGESSLFDLHQQLVDYFSLPKGEMASFYYVEGEWEVGREIPIEAFDPKAQPETMLTTTVEDVFSQESRMVFVYDFLALWSFFVERVKLADDISEPGLVASVGQLPDSPPEKSFEGDLNGMADDDFLDDDFDEEWQ